MLPDRVSNPGPLTYESGALPIALRGPAEKKLSHFLCRAFMFHVERNDIIGTEDLVKQYTL